MYAHTRIVPTQPAAPLGASAQKSQYKKEKQGKPLR